jgi:hypothetical protein
VNEPKLRAWWAHRQGLDGSLTSTPPPDPRYVLASSLDSIAAARRDVASLVDEADRDRVAKMALGERSGADLVDLPAHAILDGGRLIGFWEFDPEARRIVWATFAGQKDRALVAAVDASEAFVRDQLGDARAFSLNSPKSRRPKLDALRAMA